MTYDVSMTARHLRESKSYLCMVLIEQLNSNCHIIVGLTTTNRLW